MSGQVFMNQSIWGLILAGGFTMIPLVICSLITWGVIIERFFSYNKLVKNLQVFHSEALNLLLRKDFSALKDLCQREASVPTSHLLRVALDRLNSNDLRLKNHWATAVERSRQMQNQNFRQNLWVLGTIGSASPFIGLFGTVVGILKAFHDMARTGSGGFAVVANAISESLIATAAGIIVAVVAVMAYNALQTRANRIILLLKIHTEELSEMLSHEAARAKDGN